MNKNSHFLEALVHRDSTAISAIYETSFPLVKKFIFNNKGQLADAEDIFQKALLQIAVRYQKEKFEIKTNFEAYLFTVCKNLWRRELNKNKTKVTNEKIIELHVEEHDHASAVLEQKRQELFIEKLNLISINCKKILTLFFAKTPYNEIVNMLDYASETVVRQRVFKCKKKLTELIKGDKKYSALREL